MKPLHVTGFRRAPTTDAESGRFGGYRVRVAPTYASTGDWTWDAVHGSRSHGTRGRAPGRRRAWADACVWIFLARLAREPRMTTISEASVLACAELAHEANRIYCAALGDHSQKPWGEAEAWQRESAVEGVRGALAGNTPEQQHEAWFASKRAAGWVYGPEKDPARKTHPCMVLYGELPPAQQRKDALYIAVVRAMFAATSAPG